MRWMTVARGQRPERILNAPVDEGLLAPPGYGESQEEGVLQE